MGMSYEEKYLRVKVILSLIIFACIAIYGTFFIGQICDMKTPEYSMMRIFFTDYKIVSEGCHFINWDNLIAGGLIIIASINLIPFKSMSKLSYIEKRRKREKERRKNRK